MLHGLLGLLCQTEERREFTRCRSSRASQISTRSYPTSENRPVKFRVGGFPHHLLATCFRCHFTRGADEGVK